MGLVRIAVTPFRHLGVALAARTRQAATGLVEYAMLVALLALVASMALSKLGTSIQAVITAVTGALGH